MLTDTQVKNLKPKDKLYRMTDSHGLTIEVAVSGSRIWLHRYRYQGKATMMTLGHYPNMSLLDARQARDANKQLLKEGINPKNSNKLVSTSIDSVTFKQMFEQWHTHKTDEWSNGYAIDVKQRAESYLLPFIGNHPIDEVSTPQMLTLLKKIEDKGVLDTLSKIKSIANSVFTYSVALGIITTNPVRDLSSDAFKKKPNKHYATLTDPKDIGWLLRTIDGHKGSFQVKAALSIAPYVFLRPSELTGLTWDEVDFNDSIIRIKGNRMKMNRDHLVPMSTQVQNILLELSEIETGSNFVFPTPRNKNISITTNSLLVAIRNLGIDKEQFTTHGFRHMASTRLNELGFSGDVIERQLAHADSNKIRAVYNQAEHLQKRKDMMQQWANYLDKLKSR